MALTRRAIGVVVGACTGPMFLLASAVPAGADVIDPEGKCAASGTWESEGVTRSSGDYSPDDVIVIPQKDTVAWSGGITGYEAGAEGPRREISGEVQVDLAGIGSVTVDDWGGSSTKYANTGTHEYDLPDLLLKMKIRLHGEHRDAGERVCGGSVYLQVDGGTFSNPLSIGALIGMVASGAGLISAGIVRRA